MTKKNLQLVKVIITSTVFVILLLHSWKLLYSVHCLSLVIAFVICIVILSSYFDLEMHKKRSDRNYYFMENSWLSNALSSRTLPLLRSFIYSLGLTISTLYSIIDFHRLFWAYLLFHIPAYSFLLLYLQKKLSSTLKPMVIDTFCRELAIKLSFVAMFAIYFLTIIYGYEPEYLDNDLRQTIRNASAMFASNCGYIDTLLRGRVEIDSLFWWFTDRVSNSTETKVVNRTLWLTFLLANSLAIIGLNRFVGQVVYWFDLKVR